jgi:hypothetical protein
MKATCFVLVAEEEPDVSLGPPDCDQLAKMHPDSRNSQITFPAKLKRALARGDYCALAERRLLRLGILGSRY